MFAINTVVQVPNWQCSNYIMQMILDFYGLSNYENAIAAGFLDYQTNLDSVAKENLPTVYAVTTNAVVGGSHSVTGILVGYRINSDSTEYDPRKFRDWYFVGYNNDDRVYPGNPNMDPNHLVTIYLPAYIHIPYPPYNNIFQLTGKWVKWDLTNGNPTLDQYDSRLLLQNPNIIQVHLGNIEDLVLNGANISRTDTSLTPSVLESMVIREFLTQLKRIRTFR